MVNHGPRFPLLSRAVSEFIILANGSTDEWAEKCVKTGCYMAHTTRAYLSIVSRHALSERELRSRTIHKLNINSSSSPRRGLAITLYTATGVR
jgi:hypothetical protein